MNELNYASREESQRLVDAGIVLETDFAWLDNDGYWMLTERYDSKSSEFLIPAPSMAEVWRELPDVIKGDRKTIMLVEGLAVCGYWGLRTNLHYGFAEASQSNTNPTDALIDLLIWTKGGKG